MTWKSDDSFGSRELHENPTVGGVLPIPKHAVSFLNTEVAAGITPVQGLGTEGPVPLQCCSTDNMACAP